MLSGRRWFLGEGGDEWGAGKGAGPGQRLGSPREECPSKLYGLTGPSPGIPRKKIPGQGRLDNEVQGALVGLRVGAGPCSSLCCGFTVPAEAVGRYHQALGFSAHREPLSEPGGSTATGAVQGSVLFPTLVQQEARKGLFTSLRQTVVLAVVHRGRVCEAVFLAAGHPWWACEDLTQVLGTWELGESHAM